jgi:hypothetical protein
MSAKKRVFLLIAIMASISLSIEAVTIALLYRAAMNEERSRLVESARSQARLIEAIARFDMKYSSDYPLGAEEATLSQVIDAHNQYEGFGETGEFTLSKKQGDEIVFLLNHRHYDLNNPKPVPLESDLAEPMRLALAGLSGTIVGLDYRGVKVLAAFEPVALLDLGIVAKIDIDEVRAPFVRAIAVSGIIGLIMVGVGAAVFMIVTNPLIEGLARTVEALQGALDEVKTLGGLLPVCASCKKIRDDKGQWQQMEVYIRDRSEAEFSHGICPECVKKLYPDLDL